MKRQIALFTGTGNTLFVAEHIADMSEIAFMEDYISGKKTLDEDTNVLGILYPTYVGTVPKEVETFISEVLSKRDNSSLEYVFAITTYGGMRGSANVRVERLLRENGISLAYAASIKMPDAFLPIAKKPLTEIKSLAFVNKKLNKLDRIKNDIEIERIKLTGLTEKCGIHIHLWLRDKKDKNLHQNGLILNTEKCTGCSTCYRVCPANNIEMVDGKPKFKNQCIECYACFHRCPSFALEYKKVKSQYKGLQDTNELYRR